MRILLNTLSAIPQFHTGDEVEAGIRKVVDCFSLLEPMREVGAVEFVYDYLIESRSLLVGVTNFHQSISRVLDQGLRNEFYILTRNKMVEANVDSSTYEFRHASGALSGEMSKSCEVDVFVFNFSGHVDCEVSYYDIYDVSIGIVGNVKALHSEECIWKIANKYEASPKHRLEGYVRNGGDEVSPMRLSQEDAQRCLLQSIRHKSDFYGMHRDTCVRYVQTRVSEAGAIYHGFEVKSDEVPADVLEQLVARGR